MLPPCKGWGCANTTSGAFGFNGIWKLTSNDLDSCDQSTFDTYFYLATRFLVVSIFRLMRALSLAWRFFCLVFRVFRLSFLPIVPSVYLKIKFLSNILRNLFFLRTSVELLKIKYIE